MILIKDLDKKYEYTVDKMFESYDFEVYGCYLINSINGVAAVSFYLNRFRDICEA